MATTRPAIRQVSQLKPKSGTLFSAKNHYIRQSRAALFTSSPLTSTSFSSRYEWTSKQKITGVTIFGLILALGSGLILEEPQHSNKSNVLNLGQDLAKLKADSDLRRLLDAVQGGTVVLRSSSISPSQQLETIQAKQATQKQKYLSSLDQYGNGIQVYRDRWGIAWHLPYVDWQQNGCVYAYNSEGRLVVEGSFQNNVRHGFWVVWNWRTGQLHTRGEYRNGQRHGAWEEYGLSGETVRHGRYREGRRDGTWVMLTATGREIERKHFENGKRHGYYTRWSPDGEILREGLFVKGKKQGVWREHSGVFRYEAGTCIEILKPVAIRISKVW